MKRPHAARTWPAKDLALEPKRPEEESVHPNAKGDKTLESEGMKTEALGENPQSQMCERTDTFTAAERIQVARGPGSYKKGWLVLLSSSSSAASASSSFEQFGVDGRGWFVAVGGGGAVGGGDGGVGGGGGGADKM